MKENTGFEQESVWRLIMKNGIPAMITMIVVVIYNMADTFFVGQTQNDMMVAAVSVAAPIFTLLITIGTLIGSGGCSIISNALGSRDVDRARKTSCFCFYASIGIGVISAVIILAGCHPILRIVGATENTIDMAAVYLRIIGLGAPFIVFSNTLANVMRADGAAKESMAGNLIGTILNIVLDPVMILGFGWGIAGAAAATVIGNICACVYYIFYVNKKSGPAISGSPADFTMSSKIVVPVFSIGLPGALGNLLMSFSNIMMNLFLISYGDEAVAAMGVAMKVGMIVAMIQMGLCMGVLPILAFHFGSGKIERVRETIWKTGVLCIILGSTMTAGAFLGKHALVSAFVTGENVIRMGEQMVSSVILSGPVLGLYFLTTNVLQAAGKSLWPTITSLCRQGIVYLPCLAALNAVFGLQGLIYTQAVSDIAATVISVVVCVVMIKNCFQERNKIWAVE